jgi:hypothetical protein
LSASVLVYVEDVDAVVKQVVDGFGEVQAPFGHWWLISTHVEDLTPEEIAERAKAANST